MLPTRAGNLSRTSVLVSSVGDTAGDAAPRSQKDQTKPGAQSRMLRGGTLARVDDAHRTEELLHISSVVVLSETRVPSISQRKSNFLILI